MSPEPLVYLSGHYSFLYVCRSPQKGAVLHTYGEKHKVTVHRSLLRRKAYLQWGAAAWFPKDHPDVTVITVSAEPSKIHEKMFVFIPFLLNIRHSDVSCSAGIFYVTMLCYYVMLLCYVTMLCTAEKLFCNKLYLENKAGCKQ